MISTRLLLTLLSSAVLVAPAPAAVAGSGGSAFVGGLLGGALGSAIVNHQQRRVVVQERTVPRRAPAVNTYQREENRRVQTALNYFGFPAGAADGVLGRNSRAAIGQYQAYMGYPPTGELTEYERAFLTTSYDRAVIGGPQVGQLIASTGQGTRGLLLAFRQEQMGAPVAAAPPPAAAPAVEPAPVEVAVEPEPAAPAALPSFLPQASAASMASFCNRVSLETSGNGGFATPAAIGDPLQALGEQFCLARTYAVEQGDSLAGTVQGFSMAEMQEQCEAFAPTMWEQQARLVAQPPAEAAVNLQDFVAATGAPPAQLSGNARICLGIGYRTDNPELALASAMILVGLGEEAYDELLGHHLLNGFATPKRPDRGIEWLEAATAALAGGASPLVPANAEARIAIIDGAVASLAGGGSGEMLQDAAVAPAAPGFVLPTEPPSEPSSD